MAKSHKTLETLGDKIDARISAARNEGREPTVAQLLDLIGNFTLSEVQTAVMFHMSARAVEELLSPAAREIYAMERARRVRDG